MIRCLAAPAVARVQQQEALREAPSLGMSCRRAHPLASFGLSRYSAAPSTVPNSAKRTLETKRVIASDIVSD
jgi:hypothetical protein